MSCITHQEMIIRTWTARGEKYLNWTENTENVTSCYYAWALLYLEGSGVISCTRLHAMHEVFGALIF